MVRKLLICLMSLVLFSVCTSSDLNTKDANPLDFNEYGSNIDIPSPLNGPESDWATSKTIRPGDIILVHGSTWIDQLIKTVTQSNYSHVAGVVKPNAAIDILPFSKTGYKNLWSFSGQADVFTCDTLTEQQRSKIVTYVKRKIGTEYDYFLLVWEASRYIFNWVWPYKAGNSSLCSTLWVDAYREAGVELCPDITFPSPQDLANSNLLRKTWSY